jgi:hypothetical protein
LVSDKAEAEAGTTRHYAKAAEQVKAEQLVAVAAAGAADQRPNRRSLRGPAAIQAPATGAAAGSAKRAMEDAAAEPAAVSGRGARAKRPKL